MRVWLLVLVLCLPVVAAWDCSDAPASLDRYYKINGSDGSVFYEVIYNYTKSKYTSFNGAVIYNSGGPPNITTGGGYLYCDGTDDYFMNGDLYEANYSATEDYTYCAWVKRISSSETHIIDTGDWVSFNTGMRWLGADANFALNQDSASGVNTDPLPANTWVFVCANSNATKLNAYFNGQFKANAWAGAKGSIADSSQNTSLCVRGSDKSNDWNGYISEIMIFNKSLTEPEMQNAMSGYCTFDGGGPPPVGSGPPAIVDASYNLTTTLPFCTKWATNKSDTCETHDSTPTLRITTNQTANCTFSKYDFNYTGMVANESDSVCATTGSTEHICTLDTDLALTQSDASVYVGCITGEAENSTSTSGSLAIDLLEACEPVSSGEWRLTQSCTLSAGTYWPNTFAYVPSSIFLRVSYGQPFNKVALESGGHYAIG